MCGIAGVFTLNPKGNELKKVMNMCNTIVHRGPDEDGFFSGKYLSMGMRRLSIIDIEGGHQPLYNETGNLVLIFNGEVYNYIELKKELENNGHKFQTKSDAEVILHLYEEKGIKLLDDVNGMFAFCLWDELKNEGFIVRDRLGIKPIYYWKSNDGLMFASELKALMDFLPSIDIDEAAISIYLELMFIPAPLTPFKNVQKLTPASYIFFSKTEITSALEYWEIPHDVDRIYNDEKLRSEFFELMKDSISLQLRSDVPVGIFLSGGLDSSMIATFAIEKMKGKVSTFNVKYQGTHFDETKYAELVAKKLNSDHHIVEVCTKDVINLLPKIIWHMDEPHGDSAMVGTYIVSEFASRYVKVVLNGSGGDELFAGYSWYLEGIKLNRIMKILPEFAGNIARSICEKLGLNIEFIGIFASARKSSYLQDFFVNHKVDTKKDEFLNMYRNNQTDAINKLLYADTKYYLTDDLLLLLDKMTMAASIEGRVPLLDHRLVEWAFRINGSLKISNNTLKYLMKKWMRNILPDEIIFRPKMGFGAPVNVWMKNGLFEECFRLIDNRPESREHLYWGLHGDILKKKLSSIKGQECFKLLSLELWFKIYLDGVDKNLPLNLIR